MGCVQAKVFVVNDKEGQTMKDVEDFYKLGLNTDDFRLLFEVYSKYTYEKHGMCNALSFTTKIGIPITKFIERVLYWRISDVEIEPWITFHEFVLGIYNLLSRSGPSLLRFIFSLYDRDSVGRLNPSLVAKAVCATQEYADEPDEHRHARETYMGKALLAIPTNVDGVVTVEGFIAWCSKFSPLVFPAFDAQMTLRKLVVGDAYWRKKQRHSDRVLAKEVVLAMYREKHAALSLGRTGNRSRTQSLGGSDGGTTYKLLGSVGSVGSVGVFKVIPIDSLSMTGQSLRRGSADLRGEAPRKGSAPDLRGEAPRKGSAPDLRGEAPRKGSAADLRGAGGGSDGAAVVAARRRPSGVRREIQLSVTPGGRASRRGSESSVGTGTGDDELPRSPSRHTSRKSSIRGSLSGSTSRKALS